MRRMMSCRGLLYFAGLYFCEAGAVIKWGLATGLMVFGAGLTLAAAVKHEEEGCE